MTPTHDHATLFVAPPSPAAAAAGTPGPAADGSAEAMRRLRHPFAIPPAGADRRQPATDGPGPAV